VRVCVGAQRRHINLRQIRNNAGYSWKESSTVGVPHLKDSYWRDKKTIEAYFQELFPVVGSHGVLDCFGSVVSACLKTMRFSK
jgi:hypothetical protein